GAIDQVAKPPACGGLVTMAAATAIGGQIAPILRSDAILGGIGVEIGTDCSSNNALAFLIALHRATQLLDHTHRLVTDSQASGDRVLTFENVDVGTANSGGGNTHQCVIGAYIGDGLIGQLDTSRLDK